MSLVRAPVPAGLAGASHAAKTCIDHPRLPVSGGDLRECGVEIVRVQRLGYGYIIAVSDDGRLAGFARQQTLQHDLLDAVVVQEPEVGLLQAVNQPHGPANDGGWREGLRRESGESQRDKANSNTACASDAPHGIH